MATHEGATMNRAERRAHLRAGGEFVTKEIRVKPQSTEPPAPAGAPAVTAAPDAEPMAFAPELATAEVERLLVQRDLIDWRIVMLWMLVVREFGPSAWSGPAW